ncbi:hypothetical protein [Flagellimonas allohymeniacidonis]|uniref:STAS/SEC14 domain-containing protein n=1 Tax=Flagellimonas allohymeniacidonis TaxID=2517819 RepID=A0A4V2HSE6_9FLAO|nr:hypothetical protein [Allomuricauda hymeniacidonis]TAI47470.1 hypothetical protein EW142_12425 [Allomuricauda hymeniacidonis]
MQRVKETGFFKNIREIREYEFGVFYFFENLVISEINEGVLFGWEMATKAVDAAYEIIGRENPIAYISNRVNNYSVVPTDWRKFYFNRHQLAFYSVVGNTQGSFASLILERMFFRNNIRQFSDLETAITWSLAQVEEQKKKESANDALLSDSK